MDNKAGKTLVEKSLDGLVEKAEGLSELAKEQRVDADKQRDSADRQHRGAHRLERLSASLVEEAAEIKGEIELEAEKYGTRRRTRPGDAKPEAT